ncbi:MAG TPA: hypothetical protein VHH88_03620 [Verrucomicrobiae bacterium]|nr:hypothetical protein [Verrucomicrobiae bacterium]
MEPELPIEKTLRAAAKARREKAGEPFRMDAAVRRRLHQEISKEFPPRPRERAWTEFFAGLFRRNAWAIATLSVVLLLALTLVLRPKSGEQTRLAKLKAPAAASVSQKMDAAPEEASRSRRLLSAVAAPAAAPAQPLSESAPAESNSSSDKLALADAAPAPGPSPARMEFIRTTRQEFATSGGASGTLMKTFVLEREGSALRIIDADGSIYTGGWDKIAPGKPEANEPENRLRLNATRAAESVQGPAAWFTVSGTNRTLGKQVVISCELRPMQTNLRTATSLFTSKTVAPREKAAIISGTIQVDGRPVELRAVQSK